MKKLLVFILIISSFESFSIAKDIHAYIANSGLNGMSPGIPSIYKCPIAIDGNLDRCTMMSVIVSLPTSIVFTKKHALIVNQFIKEPGLITSCKLDTNENLIDCNKLNIQTPLPYKVIMTERFAYIADINSMLTVCPLSLDDALLKDSCKNALTDGIGASSTSFYKDQNNQQWYAYIANSNMLYNCKQNFETGQLNDCNPLKYPLNINYTISNPTDLTITINNQYIYFINNKKSTISYCEITKLNANKDFICPTINGFYKPTALTFRNNFAYITNADGGSEIGGSVSVCKTQPDGNLTGCKINQENYFAGPTDIMFH